LEKTKEQYYSVIDACKSVFLKKARDYGTSWKIMRMPSITDQILIKAERIRSLQEKGQSKVGEGIEEEFMAIVNYCVIALMQLKRIRQGQLQLPEANVDLKALEAEYEQVIQEVYAVLERKNHDYGEAWRKMRISSMTDLILMKVYRLKQIEDHAGETIASEGPEGNYTDMLNYAVFCLIKMQEERQAQGAVKRRPGGEHT